MIFCVEDDRNIRELLVYTLSTTGYQAQGFDSGKELFQELKNNRPELILLDIMLPGEDGYAILDKLKVNSSTKEIPVIMVTAKGAEFDKVKGLDAGADDYITKPFNPIEVLARVRSQLRRYTSLGGMAKKASHLTNGGIEMDDESKIVTVDGEVVSLTPSEYNILKLLMENPGRVFSSTQIYERIWNEDACGSGSVVAVHIRHLREKIEIDPSNPRYLKVVWGLGYKIEKEAKQ